MRAREAPPNSVKFEPHDTSLNPPARAGRAGYAHRLAASATRQSRDLSAPCRRRCPPPAARALHPESVRGSLPVPGCVRRRGRERPDQPAAVQPRQPAPAPVGRGISRQQPVDGQRYRRRAGVGRAGPRWIHRSRPAGGPGHGDCLHFRQHRPGQTQPKNLGRTGQRRGAGAVALRLRAGHDHRGDRAAATHVRSGDLDHGPARQWRQRSWRATVLSGGRARRAGCRAAAARAGNHAGSSASLRPGRLALAKNPLPDFGDRAPVPGARRPGRSRVRRAGAGNLRLYRSRLHRQPPSPWTATAGDCTTGSRYATAACPARICRNRSL